LICPHCREPYDPPAHEKRAYYAEMGEDENVTFYHGIGCNLCGNTGYMRRTGVFEILPLSDEVRRLFLTGAPMSDIKAQALTEGMITMRRDGMLKVKAGITTPYEVLRNVFSIGSGQPSKSASNQRNCSDATQKDDTCPHCSYRISIEWEFCPACGHRLNAFDRKTVDAI